MLPVLSTTNVAHLCVAHSTLKKEDFLDAAVYATRQGNGSASDENSGDEDEEGQLYHLNHR